MSLISGHLDFIIEIQNKYPMLILCGSIALMAAKLLSEREPGDIDFVCLAKDVPRFGWLNPLMREDSGGPYSLQPDEMCYTSYHGSKKHNNKYYELNLLVHDNSNPEITTEYIFYNGKPILVQKLEDIISWKEEYDREKDKKDLEDIVSNIVDKEMLDSSVTK